MIAEAWGGHRQMLVHLVDWPEGRVDGTAVCGTELYLVVTYPDGTAAGVYVEVCKKCRDRRAKQVHDKKPSAPVVPIGAARRARSRR